MLDLVLVWMLIGLGAFVSIISACRLWHMHFSSHKALWWVLFISAGWFGFLQMTDGIAAILVEAYEVDPQGALGLIPLAAYLWGSRVSWRDGPPKYLERS